MKATGRGTETPTSMTRQIQKPSHESQSKPVQIPTQETCHPTQALATSLERTDLEHSRQQDTPFIHQQRLVSPKTSKWISTGDGGKWTRSTEDSGSKSTQSLPLQTKHSDHGNEFYYTSWMRAHHLIAWPCLKVEFLLKLSLFRPQVDGA